MASVTVDGFAKPFDPDGQLYPAFGGRVPALRSFYLAYDVADPTPADHEINLIEVLVGGQSQDLSPTSDLNPSNLPDGRLEVALQDAHPKDEEFYYKVSHSLLDSLGARRFNLETLAALNIAFRRFQFHRREPAPAIYFLRSLHWSASSFSLLETEIMNYSESESGSAATIYMLL